MYKKAKRTQNNSKIYPRYFYLVQSGCVKKFAFGAGLGICFSQTRASHNKHDGFGRERATFVDGTISISSNCSQKSSSVNIEQQECCVIFVIFWGLFGHFYALSEFSMHLCA